MTTESKYDINKLINRPYSELTDDEIEYVIEYKAKIKSRDENYKKRIESINNGNQDIVSAYKEQNDLDKKNQNELYEAAMKRLKKINGDE